MSNWSIDTSDSVKVKSRLPPPRLGILSFMGSVKRPPSLNLHLLSPGKSRRLVEF